MVNALAPPEGTGGTAPDGQASSATRASNFLKKPRKKAPAWPDGGLHRARDEPQPDAPASRSKRRRRSGSTADHPALALVRLSEVQTEQVDWLWFPYIPKGKVTSIEGDPGVGKSWLTTAIVAKISKGQPLPGQDQSPGAQTALMLSAEDGLGDTIRPRLAALGANMENVIALDEPIILDDTGFPRLEAAIAVTQSSLVVVDPFVAYTGSKVDLHRANEVRAVMSRLAKLAEKRHCAIVVVRHLRKSRGGSAIYQGLGSIDITAACRSVLMVGTDEGAGVMAHAKCNLAPLGSSLAYSIDDGRFRWLGKSKTTAEDLVAEPDDRDTRSALAEAKDFVREALGNGPLPSTDLDKAAKEAGIAVRTLKRARRQLSIKPTQIDGHWVCSLPSEGQKAQEQKVGPLAS